jgi:rare lipoprotein A
MFVLWKGRREARRQRGGAVSPTRLAAGVLLVAGMLGIATVPLAEATAKTPGARYCFLGVCHRVKTIAETQALIGKTETVQASHYDDAKRDRFNPRNLTSSGEMFDALRPDNAASPVYPDGTKVMVYNPATKRAVVVRINNAGPYWRRRMIDLSRGAAEKLGFAHQGVATLQVRVLEAPTIAEATYRKGRVYLPVPGYLGTFASLDEAFGSARVALGLKPAAPVMVAVATWDAPVVRVEGVSVLPPPELGRYDYPAARSIIAEVEPAPATSEVAQIEAPDPSLVMVAAALEAMESEERVQPVRVAVERRALRKVAKPQPEKVKPIRLAMAVQPVPRPTTQRAPATVNQAAKQTAIRRAPTVVDKDGDDEPNWVPRARGEAN